MGKVTHGQRHTRLYRIWQNMKTRCYNPKHGAYSNYGGRGISVCDEWKTSFLSFYEWAIKNGYTEYKHCTLDRYDNDNNYSPSNCRWVTPLEQANNRRTNRYITYNGKTHTVTEWAKILGYKKSTLELRLLRGWSIDKAFTKPIREKVHTQTTNGVKTL